VIVSIMAKGAGSAWPARRRPDRPDVTMARTAPEDAFVEGVCTLEVRWILPGPLEAAVAGWLSAGPPEVESREDAYLLSPDMGGLSVKVRGGRALEVKRFGGSPGILDLPGRARGRMQHWQKWSFPFRPPSQDGAAPDGWRRVGKHRRTSRFALTGGARCAAEVTELRVRHQDWWSLGLEAAGPAEGLRAALEATAALVFTQALPGGVELCLDDSMSFAEWLRSRS
jgi:hypothetical protein